ncbi:MAG TPA: thioredoxin-like domain-containing protein [Pyrinomonadaceae bacterium]|nr:thioredoxin-like domain-containing protein [Pyrinomonadaceae bacterium]
MSSKRLIVVCVSVLLALTCAARGAAVARMSEEAEPRQQKGSEMSIPDRGRVRAPELGNNRGWLNTDQPLSLAALRGKVVLLDFWTYGCINCIHVIPDLKRLEAKYPNNLVVIGVHSAKFENEKESDNIRQIILRYEIEHPVVNDADFLIWQSYAVRAWPTQVLIDPAGYVVGKVEGEGNYEVIDEAVSGLLADFRKRGELNEQPLKPALERAKVGDMPLAFPGKILADEKSDRLYIADSNHNRIVVARLDGTVLDTIGTGERGAADGAFARATFHRPQGLALDGDALYVADTENHLLRRVDLKARTVSTIAGTGAQARGFDAETGRAAARATALNSPWDLQLVRRTLYIAMAGPHQIWRLNLAREQISVFAGSGREARTDGSLVASAFAQPSGLTTDGRTLYVADSESNIIRAVGLFAAPAHPSATPDDSEAAAPPSADDNHNNNAPSSSSPPADTTTAEIDNDAQAGVGASPLQSTPPPAASPARQVETLAGGDLFEFGDKDGTGDAARFQHPLGVLYADGALYIADTYNHKIKRLDPDTRAVKTFAGTGKPGHADGARASFYEPGGLSLANRKLYVADTNNHAVRVVDLTSGRTSTLSLRGLVPPAASVKLSEADAATTPAPNAQEIKLASQRLFLPRPAATATATTTAATGALVVEVALPAGYHLNELAPHRFQASIERGAEHVAFEGNARQLTRGAKDLRRLPLSLPLRPVSGGAAELRVQLTLYYCREDNTGACRVKTLVWRAPLNVTSDPAAPREIKLRGEIK